MTRRFLLAVAVLLASAVGAAALEPVTVTIDSVSSTNTIRGISISSATPTSVVISTSIGYRQVCIQNFDTTAFLACSELPTVSTQTAQDHVGTIIAPAPAANSPASPLCFSVSAYTNFYCRTSSVSGTTRAGVARGR